MEGRVILAAALAALLAVPAALAVPLPVFGRIVDWEGRPVAGAVVEIYRGGLLVGSVTSDSSGYFSVYLEPDTYVFRIYKEGYSVYTRSYVLTRENAGSMGVIRLEKALEVLPESSKVEASQGDTVRIPVTLQNRGIYPLSVSFSVAVPPGWSGHVEAASGLVVKNIIVKPLSNATVTLVVKVSRGAVGQSRVDLSCSWLNFTESVSFSFTVKERKWRFLETGYRVVEAYAGETVELPIRLANTLGEEESFNISFKAPPGWPVLVYDAHGVLVNAVVLKPGEARNLTLVIHVPTNASPGIYDVVVEAKAGTAVSRVSIGVNTRPGFDVVEVKLNPSSVDAVAGSNVTVTVTLSNVGTRPTTALLSVVCGVKGVKAFLIDEEGRAVGEAALLPGKPVRLRLVASIPLTVEPGSFVVKVMAKGRYSAAEGSATIYVKGKKALRVETVNYGVPAVPGTTVTFILYVKNTGTVAINSLSVRVGDVPRGLNVTVENPGGGLPPGQEARVKIRIVVSDRASEGVYNVPFTVTGDEVTVPRVLVVTVHSRAGLGYYLFATLILGVGVAAALYSRRYGVKDGGGAGSPADIPAGG